MAVVRPREHDVGFGDTARGVEEVLDALLGGDPADVEDDRSSRRDDPLQRVDAGRGRRARERVAADADPLGSDTARDDVVALLLRRDDDEPRASRDAPCDRRVEGALERHLAKTRAEHPDRLEDVGDAPRAAPCRDAGRHRVAESHHVGDVGPFATDEVRGQRRGDAHPAVAHRRCEVRDRRAVDRFDARPPRRALADVDERRRDDVDRVPVPNQAADELPCDDDRPAEGVRGPVRGARQEDSQCGIHSRQRTQAAVHLAWAVE